MTAFRNRLLGLTAGTLALSCLSSMAYAQTTEPVLNFTGSGFHLVGDPADSTFTFNQSMILNNIGWVYDGSMPNDTMFVYTTGILNSGGSFQFLSQDIFTVTDLDTVTGSGLRYLKFFTPLTVASGNIIKLVAIGGESGFCATTGFSPNNFVVGVTHSPGVIGNAAGNLRVTALGGSVAPEPGSFALALTGGAGLIGICIRRRRNAA